MQTDLWLLDFIWRSTREADPSFNAEHRSDMQNMESR